MNLDGLLDYQRDPAQQLLLALGAHGAAVDGSEMGTGKTYVACSVVRELGAATLVVAPKIVRGAWERVATALHTEVSTINYEMVRTGRTPFGRLEGKEFVWDDAIEFLVFDEVHRCNGAGATTLGARMARRRAGLPVLDTTLNGAMLRAAKRQGIPTLALSATPAQSPVEFNALGYLLGLHAPALPQTVANIGRTTLPDFRDWARRHGCRRGEFGGLMFDKTGPEKVAIMAGIHRDIQDRFVRVRIADLPDFPESQLTSELYDIEEPGEMDRLAGQMETALARLRTRMLSDKDPEHRLTDTLRARQMLELLMVPVLVELAEEAHRAGLSPVMFVNFKETIRELEARLSFNVGIIDGDHTDQNEETAARFRRDFWRGMIVQNDSGGVGIGLQDVQGQFPRAAFHLPGWSAVNFRQCTGRCPRQDSKSKTIQRVVLPNHPMGRVVHAALVGKLNNLDALVDEDLTPVNLRIV